MTKWYQKILDALGIRNRPSATAGTDAGPEADAEVLTPDLLETMVKGIVATRDDELSCAECFAELDRFVELNLAGKDAAAAMPLVQDHLTRCHDCQEEFEALLAALNATA